MSFSKNLVCRLCRETYPPAHFDKPNLPVLSDVEGLAESFA